jgi:hypothetical protein
MKTKAYLGDGVYAEFDGFAVTLTAENGIEVSNRIVLEPEVIAALNRFDQRMRAHDWQPDPFPAANHPRPSSR